MQESIKNKIYARLNDKGIIVKIFSSFFEHPIEEDVLIEEGTEEYHTHVHLKYSLADNKSRYNYKIVCGKVVELTEEEKTTLFPPVATQPTADEILRAKLMKDNANMQIQLEAQQKLNADILLKLAKVGGSANV